ncbi:MAG: cysteine desulfurase [Chloroflexi bacterium]|nr:cysteine desulfurase [Chloroflexota bacterium]
MSVSRQAQSTATFDPHRSKNGNLIPCPLTNEDATEAAAGLVDIIYLDNNASTAPEPEVSEAVGWALRDLYANPSSQHPAGRRAAASVERAREQVAALISCAPRAITFTSGASEADGLAICGLWEGNRAVGLRRNTVIVGATEHAAVLESARSLRAAGARVIEAPVDRFGMIALDALRKLVDEDVLLVSVMAANSETGTLAPLSEVAAIAKECGAYVHTDATQYVGRLSLDMEALDLDMVSLSGHKMHGPKGVGALAVRRGVPIAPRIRGGGHERGLRSGTLNTPGIVGLGVAAELALGRFGDTEAMAGLRNRLHQGLSARLDGVHLNGHQTERLPNTVNLRFSGADAEAVMTSLRRVACSAGSACSSGIPAPSHVLVAMGLSPQEAHQSLRFSLSRNTTTADVDAAIDELVAAVTFVRESSPAMGA